MSNAIQDRLQQSAGKIFDKFVTTVAKVDPRAAAGLAATFGIGLVGMGLLHEVLHQADLLASLGQDAVDAYRKTTPSTLTQLMGRALSGDLHSPGMQAQGAGAWALVTLPAVAAITTHLYKGLEFVKAASEREAARNQPCGAVRQSHFDDAMRRAQNLQATPAQERPSSTHRPGP